MSSGLAHQRESKASKGDPKFEHNIVKWNASIFRGKILKNWEQMNTVQRAVATTRKAAFQVEDFGSSVATVPRWRENLLNVEETCKAWKLTGVRERG